MSCKRAVRSVAFVVLLALAGAGCVTAGRDSSASRAPTGTGDGVKGVEAVLSNVPLSFVQNRGQVDGPVNYYVQGADTSLYFGPGGVTYTLSKTTAPPQAATDSLALPSAVGAARQRWAVKLDFVGANTVAPTGVDLAKGVVSYFGAGAERSHTAIPTYSSIAYRELWPGIDMVYAGTGSQLKYSFLVHPGADPSRIRLAYRGPTDVALNHKGQIEVTTPAGGFTDDKPLTYQDLGGTRVEVPSSYVLQPGTEPGTWSYGFRLGSYDASAPLVLDPAVFVYAGYIGGTDSDTGEAIAVDESGNAYVTGVTYSDTEEGFPATVGPDLTLPLSATSSFVAKVSGDGTQLLYAGYIDGMAAQGIAVDATGAAYVTGGAGCCGPGFPATIGPNLNNAGRSDAVVVKVNPAGTGLDYAGYIGGSEDDSGHDIAVDNLGNAFVGGDTYSSDLPTTVGPDLTANGSLDVFVAKVNSAGTGLDYLGYIGGSGDEGAVQNHGLGIAIDGSGAVYVTAMTSSTEATFPVAVGPDLTYNKGGDVFVAKVKPAGTGLDYAGYIGGSKTEYGGDVAVDAAGHAYVTGTTLSPVGSFPRAVGPKLSRSGPTDVFVAKVTNTGNGIAYAGFVGSKGNEYAKGIAVDDLGAAYVIGWTTSQRGLASGGPDDTFGGGPLDGFIAKVMPDGRGFAYTGYIGGAANDDPFGVAVDGLGAAYVAGVTRSPGSTFPVMGGPDLVLNDGTNPVCGSAGVCTDAYVVKIRG